MLRFFDQFSESFYIALILWPVTAMLLTIPSLLWQYRRKVKITGSYVAFSYVSALYGLGLVAFTLYPLPDDPAGYCLTNSVRPQLIPLHWIGDVLQNGRNAALQIIMNFVFFLPLGVLARNFSGLRWPPTLALGLLCSLVLEVAQLTGLFGLYPCSYRLFDVDDLGINTFGAVAGYGAGRYLLRYREVPETGVAPSFNRQVVALCIDVFVVYSGTWFLALVAHAALPGLAIHQTAAALFVVGIVLTQGILPYFRRGQTLGGRLVGLTLDTRARTGLHRVLFYAAYVASVLLVTLTPPWLMLI